MMTRTIAATFAALALIASNADAAGIKGQYIEARTCDVWTGPCFANAEVNFNGKHAVLGWKIDVGSVKNVKLDGLGIVAVVAASETLGTVQSGNGQAVLLVDRRADTDQKDALVSFAKTQAGALLKNVVRIESAEIDFFRCECKEDACAIMKAGAAKIETRCLGKHDKLCGNESAYYPPLARNVKVTSAVASEHTYKGQGLKETWKEHGRRSAYLGTFETR